MGYADFANFRVPVLDGYAFTPADGYTLTSDWIDVHSAPIFSVSFTTTGGSPAGTVKLQQSNQLQWTGGNRPQPLQTAGVGAVDDTTDVPSGTGANTATISGAGTVVLNQYQFGARWVRVTVTFSAPVTTAISCVMTWKKP